LGVLSVAEILSLQFDDPQLGVQAHLDARPVRPAEIHLDDLRLTAPSRSTLSICPGPVTAMAARMAR
jgi:hypothetical protein